MKRLAIILAGLAVAGSAAAYDLAWKYDTLEHPADVACEKPADLEAGVDARANVARTLETTPPGAELETRWYSRWLGQIMAITRQGLSIIIR